MFGFVKKHILGIFSNYDETDFVEEDEETILSKLKEDPEEKLEPLTEIQPISKPLGERPPVEYECEVYKYTKKSGVITCLNDNYGVIDNRLYFHLNRLNSVVSLEVNDKVSYTTYIPNGNETEKVHEVFPFENDEWEFDIFNGKEISEKELEETREFTAITRVLNGRITKKDGRNLFIEPCNIWCNLDKVEVSYLPSEGDWVSLEAAVTLNEKVVDLTGEILEVKSVKPLLTKTGFGKITLWSKSKNEGAIDSCVYFCIVVCELGYIPELGDTVVYDAVESDQDIYKWRALKILPHVTNKRREIDLEKDPEEETYEVEIRPNPINVFVELGRTVEFSIHVTNQKKVPLQIIQAKFTSPKSRSQLYLISHKFNQGCPLSPKETVTYRFELRGRYLGLSQERFCFYFQNFRIFRRIDITVTPTSEMNRYLKCNSQEPRRVKPTNKYVYDTVDMNNALFGRKPWKAPKFILGEKKHVYRMPNKLWEAVVTEDKHKTLKEKVKDLETYAPYLKEDLCFKHYTDWFHTLLFLEEIEIKKNFRTYDISGAILLRDGDYFTLQVPGLYERRPSVIVGDKIIVTQPWAENKIQQVGFVHEVRQNEVLIKFHNSFHETYDESECDIVFDPNLSYLWRSHDAVVRSSKKLGEKWLFPKSVDEKDPLVDVSVENVVVKTNSDKLDNLFTNACTDGNTEIDLSEQKIDNTGVVSQKGLAKNPNKTSVGTKPIAWCNENLNERQKIAVVGALRAQGRPLPYIIFGPPGTGKTITIVEIILQIYKLIPNSRILVVSPSNSSADLICQRLIEWGKFLPGELVRLIAYYRANENSMNPKLIPYCALVDNKDEPARSYNPANKNNLCPSGNQMPGRSRITCGTCTCVGSLHFVGFYSGHFSHIIIDEAGQATEPEALIATTFLEPQSGVVILAGDPQQLGPVCVGKMARNYGLTVSLLQRLVSSFPYVRDMDSFPSTSGFDKRFITRLNINYRSVPEILSLPSQLFYNSELIPTVSPSESREGQIIKSLNIEVEGRKDPPAIIFHGVIGQNYQEKDSPSWYNPHEIWVLTTYLKKIYSLGYTMDDVGVITPYLKQAQKIRQLLDALKMSIPKIGTVEDFQGQERYIVILSAVRSSLSLANLDVKKNLGFLASPRRLNVALTRARAVLVIIGNPAILSMDPYWRSVIQYCTKNNSYIGCNVNTRTLAFNEEDDGCINRDIQMITDAPVDKDEKKDTSNEKVFKIITKITKERD